MKKLSKVLLAAALLILIASPLTAAKAMNVTWQWLLNDPYVTSYRYQIDGEAEDGWTVVDGNTDTYVATGLDPYKDYTLYLQCTYDGVLWSDSATSTAYALLEYVEEAPVVEEPVVEEVPAVEEAPVVEEKLPETASFTVFGYGVDNSWIDGKFTSVTELKGLVGEEDVRGFASYEVEKYGDFLLNNTSIEFVEDGFVLTYPEEYADPADYISTYKADLEEYVAMLFAPKEEPVVVEEAPVVEEPVVVETPAVEERVVEEPAVPVAPLAPVAVDVPVVVEEPAPVAVTESPKAKKVSDFNFRLSGAFGAEFGFSEKVDYVTIFPRLDIGADFQNVISFGSFGLGTRLDFSVMFKPLNGTFIGHEFKYFLNGNNWAMDATVDAKLMAYINMDSVTLYAGAGAGYSLASNTLCPLTHDTTKKVIGFNPAIVFSAVAGFDVRLGESFSVGMEAAYRYFLQNDNKSQTLAANVVFGFNF